MLLQKRVYGFNATIAVIEQTNEKKKKKFNLSEQQGKLN